MQALCMAAAALADAQVHVEHRPQSSLLCPSAVSRIKAKSEVYEMDLLLDVNVDIYPLDVRQHCACMASAGPVTTNTWTLAMMRT